MKIHQNPPVTVTVTVTVTDTAIVTSPVTGTVPANENVNGNVNATATVIVRESCKRPGDLRAERGCNPVEKRVHWV